MVIQTPFIIAPTHQASAKKASASASGDEASVAGEGGPQPLVLAGPSGAGKSTLIKRLMGQFSNSFGFSVSHTTRSPREGEEDGVAYNFVSQQQMKEVKMMMMMMMILMTIGDDDVVQAIANGEFIEH